MTPSRLRWGLLLTTIGVMLLLNNTGALDWEYWWDLLFWWPIILIAIGIEKIFLKTSLKAISYLAPFILVVTMVLVAVETGSDGDSRGYFSTHRWSEKADPSVTNIEAVINHGGSDLNVNRSTIDLATARFDRFTRKPKIDFSKSGNTARLEITRRKLSSDGTIIIAGHRYGKSWNMAFSEETPLFLKCQGDESDLNLDLRSIPLEKLDLDESGGEIYLRIGDKRPKVAVAIFGDNSRLRLRVPGLAGLKVEGREQADYLKNMGMAERAGYFITDGFDTSKVQIELKLDDELDDVSIESY